MIALTAYEWGQLTAALVLPVGMFVWMAVWIRRGKPLWWIPAVLGGLATLLFLGQLIPKLGDGEPAAAPSPTRSIDPQTVFLFTGYRLEPLDSRTQAQLNDAAADPLDELESATGRRVLTDSRGEPVGSVLVYSVRPALAGHPRVLREFMAGLTSGHDATPRVTEVAGIEVQRVGWNDPGAGRLEFVVWGEENLIIVAGAGTTEAAEAIAEAVITR